MGIPTLPFSTLSDAEVRDCLRKYSIGLTVEEARKVQEMLGRAPTIVEAVIWGIQGSEHCSYKSSRRFLKNFPTTGKHVILGPGEDSGIVAITDGPPGKRWGIVISHESHNHPSQIVPFEGAATGVGGTVRDVACMGARVIGCMDMLRLGSLKNDSSRNIAKEVCRGIAGYGNPLGVPNLGGDTVFDSAYDDNCLVNAIAIGIVREDQVIHSFVPEEAADEGYDIILVGKPTDRSGFGGAAFASISMEEQRKEQNTGAVQEPNPFLERHLLISTYALFDWLAAEQKLDKVSFKDLGAGGVVCASVEQVAARGFGADVDLDKVHVSLDHLPPEVIACAETQERFCWICHPSLTEKIVSHYNVDWDLPSVAEKARASVIGKVTNGGMYRLRHQGVTVCDAKSEAITSGLQYVRPTSSEETQHAEPCIECDASGHITLKSPAPFQTTIDAVFRAMLAHPNHASKQPVIRHYDKTVIGNTIVEAGEADASVIMPLFDAVSYLPSAKNPAWDVAPEIQKIGVAFAADGNPRYGRISAYWQGFNATCEAVCNVASCGAEPRALTDCLNYGNPEIPSQLSALEQGVKGIADAARALGGTEPVPVISGNVSLYNGTPGGNAIPASAIVCCMGVLKDATRATSGHLMRSDSALYLLGSREQECGGSAYYEVLEDMAALHKDALLGQTIPQPDASELRTLCALVRESAAQDMICSCHDISDGGVLLALYEMTVSRRRRGGAIGAEIDVSHFSHSLSPDKTLFTQTSGFLVEVCAEAEKTFVHMASKMGVQPIRIGSTLPSAELRVRNGKETIVSTQLADLHSLWDAGLHTALQSHAND
jgi:phosphoribosylformylglycinamidine synthase